MTVLRVRVMACVMFGRLQDAQVLQPGNDAAVFFARTMRPFVKLIRVGAQQRKEPDRPRQTIQLPGDEHGNGGEQDQIPRTLPPAMAGHVAWKMVMNGVGPPDQAADERRVFTDIRVFEPENAARDKLRGKNCSDEFQR
jgi:hypothetical protein